jgi:hypothetical protein
MSLDVPSLRRLKRALRPLRPALLPAWRLARSLVRHGPRAAWRAWASERRRARFTDPSLPIHPISRRQFDEVAARFPYYRRRWRYTSVAGDIAGELILRDDLRTALEVGPHVLPLIVGADVMDLRDNPDLVPGHQVIVHDATKAPWPMADRQYDLFVALQVFEHLGGGQRAAFREVRRVARHAVISLPIDWVMRDPTNCHHMISHERALSWFAPVAPTRVVLGNGGRGKRLIYVFEDMPPPQPGDPEPGADRPA